MRHTSTRPAEAWDPPTSRISPSAQLVTGGRGIKRWRDEGVERRKRGEEGVERIREERRDGENKRGEERRREGR